MAIIKNIVFLLSTTFLVTTNALAINGSATGEGKEKLKIEECGQDVNYAMHDIQFTPDGKWSADAFSGTYSGRYEVVIPGEILSLSLNKRSKSKLYEYIGQTGKSLCGVKGKILSPKVAKFIANFNDDNALKVVLRVKYKATDGATKTKGVYKVVTHAAYTPNKTDTKGFIPITTWEGPLGPAPQSKPGFYETVTDTVFDTTFRRVTKDDDRGYYSLRPVFNRDSSKFLLNSRKIKNVIDGSDFGNLWELSGKQSFRNPIWSKVDPDIIYGTIELQFVSLNIVTEEIKVIRDMAALDAFVSTENNIYMDNQQAISGDDEFIVISDIPRGGTKIIVVNIQTGARRAWIKDAYAHPDFTVRIDDGPDYRMNAGISASGKYIVISGAFRNHLFDGKLNYIRKLAKHGHADFAIDTEGSESFISICPAKMERLSDGKITDLLGPDTYACGHLNASANYKQPGWAYLSINKDKNDVGANGNSQGYEIVGVKLDPADGTQVRRIVHPRNTGDSNETSAYAVPNAEGTLLMFNSTWDDAGNVKAYIVDLLIE